MRFLYKKSIEYFSQYKKPKQIFRDEVFDFYKNEGIAFPNDYIRTINLYRKLKMPITDEYLINDVYGNMAYLTDAFILYCLPILIPHSLIQEDKYLLNMLKRIELSSIPIDDKKMITELLQEMENDLSFFHEHYLYPLCINGLYGFINHMGGLEIEPQFETATETQCGVIAGKIDKIAKYFDCEGKFLFDFETQNNVLDLFYDNLLRKNILTNGKELWGFVNKSGEWEIPPIYKEVGHFKNSTAKVTDVDGESYYISKKNEKKTSVEVCGEKPKKTLGLFPFISGNMMYGFKDDSNEVIIEPKFDYVKPFNGYLASVTINGISGYTDKYGSVYLSTYYE